MKIALLELKKIIREVLETPKKVARFIYQIGPLEVDIDGKTYDLDGLVEEILKRAGLKGFENVYEEFDQPEDVVDYFRISAIEDLLRSHRVTDVIDQEWYGSDSEEHPIEEYLSSHNKRKEELKLSLKLQGVL